MKNVFLKSLLFFACFAFCMQSNAQDAPTPKKYENPEWRNIVFVDFHSGKMGRAMEIIQDYYQKAGAKAGTPGPVAMVEMETGEYDLMLVWAMEGGIEDMNWDISPNNIKWRKALNEVCGGADKADAIRKEYSSLVRSSTNALGRVSN